MTPAERGHINWSPNYGLPIETHEELWDRTRLTNRENAELMVAVARVRTAGELLARLVRATHRCKVFEPGCSWCVALKSWKNATDNGLK